MKRTVLLALCLGLGSSLAAVAETTARLEDLSWLAGSWSGEVKGSAPGTRFETHYTTPQGGVILSSSKAFGQDGKLRWFELERFEARDGVLQVTPYPNGKASVSFTLVEYDPAAKKAVFANPQHDYPKRITYQRVADDRLLFVVEGGVGEGAPVMEFSLSRQP